jgi:zinc transport system ATP-binding protein
MSERAGSAADGARAGESPQHRGAHHDQHGHDQHSHGPGCSHHHEPRDFDPSSLISGRGLRVARSGRLIITDIDIDIRPREIVTLIGPNGSGKTTLVRALLGLERLAGGAIRRAEGVRIGYVPQRFDIDSALPMTVERFLELGGGERKLHIGDALGEVGAAHVRTQQLSELSGGELQRVVLARALIGNPSLLVLDEPVRGVDYVGEAELYTLIGRLRDTRGFGVLLVSHDLHVVMAASDRVICLNRHVCCSGVPETVAQHPEYVRLFGPETARAFGVYHHHHDHRHDLAGEPAPDHPDGGPA